MAKKIRRHWHHACVVASVSFVLVETYGKIIIALVLQ